MKRTAGDGRPVNRTGGIDVLVRAREVGEYPVRIGVGSLEDLPALMAEWVSATHVVVIGDDRVVAFHGERVRTLLERDHAVTVLTFPAGEASKVRSEWARLTDETLAAGVGRDGCVVALGGGVTGDLAGFVAATYMRGIPVVQIPTSLVAMIDSSVGGKTGVDLPGGKNLAGAFHPPRFVLIDPELARTLEPSERAQGLVEALKHGAIRDEAYFERLVRDAPDLLEGDPEATSRMVLPSVRIKADVVTRDEHEGGLRQILNFGHTLGHALEAASGYRLPHGSAVGRGMVLESLLGERVGVTEAGTAERIADAVRALGLNPRTGPLDKGAIDDLLFRTTRDKKARAGEVRYVLLRRIGAVESEPGWSRPVPSEAVRATLESLGGAPV